MNQKISRYNNFVFYQGNYIGHNGMSNDFIVIDPILLELYNTAKTNHELNELKIIHPAFYELLLQNGFIVRKEIDELQECINAMDKCDSDDTKFELHINSTMNCNFKCWYCYETHIKDSKISDETKGNILSLVHRILENKKLTSFQLNWFGGEPLLYFAKTVSVISKEIYKLCKTKNIDFHSVVTTNGLLINDDVIAECSKCGIESFQITLDGHRDRHNQVRFISKERGSYDIIINNIKKLVSKNFKVNVRVNCSEETFSDIEKIARDFQDLENTYRNNIAFDFHEVWQVEKTLQKDISSVSESFRAAGFNVYSLDVNYFGLSCYADKKNHALINYNGEVFKCSARDFTHKNSEGILHSNGEIIWNSQYKKRFQKKHTNKPCLECSIFPICGGGCSQLTLENDGKDYCVYDYDEDRKKSVILNNFLATIQ